MEFINAVIEETRELLGSRLTAPGYAWLIWTIIMFVCGFIVGY